MAKETLLQIVQEILDSISGDEVNSINDTVESLQIARIVVSTFKYIVSSKDWLHLQEMGQLNGSGDNNKPTHMTLDDGVTKVDSIFYNKRKLADTKDQFQPVKYLFRDDFLRHINQRDSSDTSNIKSVVDTSGVTLLIRKDQAPNYYTSFDDENIVFDSYDSTVDSTLQGSKTQVLWNKIPSLSMSDTAVADLPEEAFALLKEESKSTAWFEVRQQANPKAEVRAKQSDRRMSVDSWTVNTGMRFPNYGRK